MKTATAASISAIFVSTGVAHAEVTIEKTLLSPLGQGFSYVASPAPAYVATTGPAGSRMAVYIDGEPGPKFDEIVVTQPTPEGGGGIAIVFSPDGTRHAYVGRKRGEFKLMVDGEEVATGNIDNQYNSISGVGFTPDSKHYFYRIRQTDDQNESPVRFVMDGVESVPLSPHDLQVLVAPAGGGFLILGKDYSTGEPIIMRDGEPWETDASRFVYRHDGKLFTFGMNADGSESFVHLDDEELYRGPFRIQELIADDVGESWAMTGYAPGGMDMRIMVNGELIDGKITTMAGSKQILFSDDGSRWAVTMEPQTGRQYVVADGEEYDEYIMIHELAFSPDSRHLTFWGRSPSGAYFVINGEEQDGVSGINPPAVYGGDSVGWVEVGGQPPQYCALFNGERYVGNHNLHHSTIGMAPDGSRMAFMQQNTVMEMNTEGTIAYEDIQVIAPGRHAQGYYRPMPNGFMFSPDSQLLVYYGNNRQAGTKGIFFNNKQVIQDDGTMVARAGFSPDSMHFYCVLGSADGLTLYVDGEPVMRYAQTPFTSDENMWHIDDGGVLHFVTADNEGIKRVTVTPSPDRSVADMIGG